MAYRDENEALRARIAQLEEEVRVLRAKPEPPRPVEPSPPPPDSKARGRARTRAVAGAIIVAVILAAAGIVSRARLWRSANPASPLVEHEASPVWRQDRTFVCPQDGDVTL